ncbi:MAG: dihydrodipicolinate synthase family protein [Deinococcales bacterium]
MFKGLFPPVPTPFKRDGSLDLPALQNLIAWLGPHVDGYLILGSNGEAVYLDEAERQKVLEAAREAIPKDKIMLAGAGGEATAHVIERCRDASEAGADAVLVLAPYYNRANMTPNVLETHFMTVANSSPLPVYVYNIPQVSGIAHAPAWFSRVGMHPNIAGVKDSSGDIMNFTEIGRLTPEGFNLLTGNAPTLLPALTVGAHGAILAAGNVIPQIFQQIMAAFKAGQMDKALELQRLSNPLSYAVTRDYGVPGLKAAMRLLEVSAGYPRAPLLDVDAETSMQIERILKAILG